MVFGGVVCRGIAGNRNYDIALFQAAEIEKAKTYSSDALHVHPVIYQGVQTNNNFTLLFTVKPETPNQQPPFFSRFVVGEFCPQLPRT
jgi:hypothetical protein